MNVGDFGVWVNPVDEQSFRKHYEPRKGWNPNLPGINWKNVVNQVLLEIWKWQEQELFSFHIPWNGGSSAPLNVPTALTVLDLLDKFLSRAKKSEDEAVQEMLSAFVQSDAGARSYIWWLLEDGKLEAMDSVVLGPELAALLKGYALARSALHDFVDEHIKLIRIWGDSYGEKEIRDVLDKVHQLLDTARMNFQFYKESLFSARFRRRDNAQFGMLPKAKIRQRMANLYRSIYSAPHSEITDSRHDIMKFLSLPEYPPQAPVGTPVQQVLPSNSVSGSSLNSENEGLLFTSPVLKTLCSWRLVTNSSPVSQVGRSGSSSSAESRSGSASPVVVTTPVGSLGGNSGYFDSGFGSPGIEEDDVFCEMENELNDPTVWKSVREIFPEADPAGLEEVMHNIVGLVKLTID